MGFFVRDDWHGRLLVDHGGNGDNGHCMLALVPEEKMGFVLLQNVSWSKLQHAARERIFEILLDEAP